MAVAPILNPDIPYVGEIEGGVFPGKMVKIQGTVPSNAERFAVNYQLGPNLIPRDDIAIHVAPRFTEGFVTRNHIQSMTWGPEENEGPLWIQPGQGFEIIILCDHNCYKIAINGRHFTEFAHRLPYQKVTHLVIDGDVHIRSIFYEIIPVGPPQAPHVTPVPDVSAANFGPPPPGGLYPSLNPQQGPPPGEYGPPPNVLPHGPPGAYGQPGGHVYYPEKPEEQDAFSGCLDKMGLALGGLVAAGGAAAVASALNKRKEQDKEKDYDKSSKSENESGFGGLSALGAALASSLAANALQGDSHNKYPPNNPSGYPPTGSGSGGVLGSILGALGSGGTAPPPTSYSHQPSTDPLSGTIGSLLGGVLGGGGSQQHSGGYQPSGGYTHPPQQGSNDLLSNIGAAVGSSLLNSALENLTKKSKDKSHDNDDSYRPPPQNNYDKYTDVPPAHPPSSPRSTNPPQPSGGKLSAADISKGLGLGDDDD